MGRLARRRRHEQGLVAAGQAPVLRLAVVAAVAPNQFAAALGAAILGIAHNSAYVKHPDLEHRQIFVFANKVVQVS